jgi:hypothetical protein
VFEGVGELFCPGPSFGYPQDGLTGSFDDPGGGVQQSVTQGLRFGVGEVAAEQQQPGPAQRRNAPSMPLRSFRRGSSSPSSAERKRS